LTPIFAKSGVDTKKLAKQFGANRTRSGKLQGFHLFSELELAAGPGLHQPAVAALQPVDEAAVTGAQIG